MCLVSQHVDAPHILVDDVEVALGALARAYLALLRTEGDITVIGITGSNGKTTTKDLLAQTLAARRGARWQLQQRDRHAAHGARRGLVDSPPGARDGRERPGAHRVSDVDRAARTSPWCSWWAPRTRAATARPDGIARAKAELVAASCRAGVAILNADDAAVAAMAALAARVVTFGQRSTADVRASDVTLAKGRASFVPVVRGASGPRVDAHARWRAPRDERARRARRGARVRHDRGRGRGALVAQRSPAERAPHGRHASAPTASRIIDDSYNASPESMRAAFRALLDVASRRPHASP